MILPIQVGDQAPGFKLNNKDYKAFNLDDCTGKWVVLFFYPKDDTKGWTQEAKDFSLKASDFEKENAIVIGISPDSEKSHTKFAEKHSLTVELLSDSDHAVLEKYGVWQKKKIYGKEYMGVVRTTVLINPAGIVAMVWEKVKVNNHAEIVFQSLLELKAHA